MRSRVLAIRSRPGEAQLAKQRRERAAKARLKDIRECVVYTDNVPTSVEWVLITTDILTEAQHHVTTANRIWEAECLKAVVYTVDGEDLTRADAYVALCKAGYDREACERWWKRRCFQLSGKPNKVPEVAYKRRRKEEMLA